MFCKSLTFWETCTQRNEQFSKTENSALQNELIIGNEFSAMTVCSDVKSDILNPTSKYFGAVQKLVNIL